MAELPVDLASGQATFTLPLFTVEGATLSLPISLSYRTSEINLSVVPSSVGQNWSLQAGGLVSRTVFGLPDDDPFGYPFTGYDALQDDDHFYPDDPDSPDPDRDKLARFIRDVEDRKIDVHPDGFSFVSPGGSGQFAWYQPGAFQVTPASDFRIERNVSGCSKGVLFPLNTCWVITAPDGTRYFYEEPEITLQKSENAGRSFYFYEGQVEYASSWYLTRVVAPGGDEITLEYDTDSFYSVIKNPSAERKYLTFLATDSGSSAGSCSAPVDVVLQSFGGTRNVRLREIRSAKHRVTFRYGWRSDAVFDPAFESIAAGKFTPRTSHPDGYQERRLEGVDVATADGVTIKTFDLLYNEGSLAYGRLRLDEIHETGADGTARPPYRFAYYDWASLPDRLSPAVDHWGVYNGAVSNEGLVPTVRLSPSENPFGLGGSTLRGNAREPGGLVEGRAGLLRSITYPTGGSTEIEYEPHDFGYRVRYGGPGLVGEVVDARHPSPESYERVTLLSRSDTRVEHRCGGSSYPINRTLTFVTPSAAPGEETVEVEVDFKTGLFTDNGFLNRSVANITDPALTFQFSAWSAPQVNGEVRSETITIELDPETSYEMWISAGFEDDDGGPSGPPVIDCGSSGGAEAGAYASAQVTARSLKENPTYDESAYAGGARVRRIHTRADGQSPPVVTEYAYRLFEGAESNEEKSSGALMGTPQYKRFTGTIFGSCECAELVYLQYGSNPDFARLSGPRVLYSQVRVAQQGAGSTTHTFRPGPAELADVVDFAHTFSSVDDILGSSRLTDLSWARGLPEGEGARASGGAKLVESSARYEVTRTSMFELESPGPEQPRIRGLNYTRAGEETKKCCFVTATPSDFCLIFVDAADAYVHFSRYWVSPGIARPVQRTTTTYELPTEAP